MTPAMAPATKTGLEVAPTLSTSLAALPSPVMIRILVKYVLIRWTGPKWPVGAPEPGYGRSKPARTPCPARGPPTLTCRCGACSCGRVPQPRRLPPTGPRSRSARGDLESQERGLGGRHYQDAA